jgi:predicted acyl esterase
VATAPAGPGVAVYDSAPLTADATMIGATTLSIDYDATTADGLQLNSRLYDVLPNGTAVMVDRGVRRVTHANGTETYELHGNGWRFPAGHLIRIEVSQDEGLYVKHSVIPSSATIHGVRLRIPVRETQPCQGDGQDSQGQCPGDN